MAIRARGPNESLCERFSACQLQFAFGLHAAALRVSSEFTAHSLGCAGVSSGAGAPGRAELEPVERAFRPNHGQRQSHASTGADADPPPTTPTLGGPGVRNSSRSLVMRMHLEETLTGPRGVWQLAVTVDKRVVAEGMLTPLSKALVQQWDALCSLDGDDSLLPMQKLLSEEEAELDKVNEQCVDLQRQLNEAGVSLKEDTLQGPWQTSEYSRLRSELERIPMPQVCPSHRCHPFVQCVAL
jgi:hypothetical protein